MRLPILAVLTATLAVVAAQEPQGKRSLGTESINGPSPNLPTREPNMGKKLPPGIETRGKAPNVRHQDMHKFQQCIKQLHHCKQGHPAKHPQCHKTLETCCQKADKDCLAHPPKAGDKKCNHWKQQCDRGKHVGPKMKDHKKQKGEKPCHANDKKCKEQHRQSKSQSPLADYTPPAKASKNAAGASLSGSVAASATP